MIVDSRNRDEVPNSLRADCVVVGAGTVGLFLAVLLARQRRQVVILEAGGRAAQSIQGGPVVSSIGKQHRGMNTARAMGLGGTSVLWGGQLAEFDAIDLERPDLTWPISHAELTRWYNRVYQILGVERRLSEGEYRARLGKEPELHFGVDRIFTLWAPQPNFAHLFKCELSTASDLKVLTHATANSMEFSGSRARAIIARVDGGRRIRVEASNFVLAAGTIANARFLLSTQLQSEVPWKSCRQVGKAFQDHLGGKVAEVEVESEARFRSFFENAIVNDVKLQPKLRLVGAARLRVPSGVSGLFVFRSRVAEHVGNIKMFVRALRSGTAFSRFASLPRDLLAVNRSLAPFVVRYLRDRRVFAFFEHGVELHVQAEQIPLAGSDIQVAGFEPLEDGLLPAAVNWQIDGREAVSIRTFLHEADQYLRLQHIARLTPEAVFAQDDTVLLRSLSDTAHQCGGAAMSSDRHSGVTDPDCRIWGTDNVFIAGAAVFPTSSHANCTLTALALTTRLSELLNSPWHSAH